MSDNTAVKFLATDLLKKKKKGWGVGWDGGEVGDGCGERNRLLVRGKVLNPQIYLESKS